MAEAWLSYIQDGIRRCYEERGYLVVGFCNEAIASGKMDLRFRTREFNRVPVPYELRLVCETTLGDWLDQCAELRKLLPLRPPGYLYPLPDINLWCYYRLWPAEASNGKQ